MLGDGAIAPRGGRIEVRGASTVTLLVAVATSYVNYADVSGDPVKMVRVQTDSAARKTYAQLRSAYIRAHQALFHRMSLRIGSHSGAATPTNQRIADVEQHPDAALAALYVQYGRYLLMSSSRPGSQPANLQGIWNEGNNPHWGSKYIININTQMNYWAADGPIRASVSSRWCAWWRTWR